MMPARVRAAAAPGARPRASRHVSGARTTDVDTTVVCQDGSVRACQACRLARTGPRPYRASTMAVVVVGAGLAGVACGVELAAAGVDVRVVERARTVGGRMASKRIDGRPVDLGAAYFTVRDPEFAQVVARWRTAGLARPWTSELAVLGRGERGRAPGPGPLGRARWAAQPGRSARRGIAGRAGARGEAGRARADRRRRTRPTPSCSPCPTRRLAASSTTTRPPLPWSTAAGGGRSSPSPPAGRDASGRRCPPRSSTTTRCSRSSRTTATGAATARRCWSPTPPTSSPAAATPVPTTPSPPSSTPCATCWACAPSPLWTHAHRWRYASPPGDRDAPFHLGDDGVALAGDGWGSARVETAWLSGTALGRALVDRLRKVSRTL